MEENFPTILISMLLSSGYCICEISTFLFCHRILEVQNKMYPVLKLTFEAVKILMLDVFVFPDSRDLFNSFDTLFVFFHSTMNKSYYCMAKISVNMSSSTMF